MSRKPFHFKQFSIYHDRCAMKVGTDGVLLGAWANVQDANTILDIGTGTGLIAIMAAQRTEDNVAIDAVEIDQDAYEQAKENVANCNWHQRITLHNSSIQQFTTNNSGSYDLIISNPPYFQAGTQPKQNNRNTARHTVSLTSTDLVDTALHLLSPTGKMAVILPEIEGRNFIDIAVQKGLHATQITAVRPKADKPIERLLITISKQKSTCQTDEITLQFEKRNDFTPAYIALTKDFYTIL